MTPRNLHFAELGASEAWEGLGIVGFEIKDLNSFSEKFGPGETANIFRAEFMFFQALSCYVNNKRT